MDHGVLCGACWHKVRFIERPYCERLGTPFPQDYGQTLLSPAAMADPPVFERARAVARFEDGPARHLIHRLKYGDRVELALSMGKPNTCRPATETEPDGESLVNHLMRRNIQSLKN